MNCKKDWVVYMVVCADGSLYTGITTDLERRLEEHNSSSFGAKYTRARRPVSLAFFENAESRSAASIREHAIKKMTRSQKLALL